MFRKKPIGYVEHFFVIMFFITSFLSGDIFLFKKMEIKPDRFIVARDIFKLKKRSENLITQRKILIKEENLKIEEKKQELRTEIKDSIVYEGMLRKGNKILALLNLNGDFFIVSRDDKVLNKIKILDINGKKITVLADSVKIEILKKGETDGQ